METCYFYELWGNMGSLTTKVVRGSHGVGSWKTIKGGWNAFSKCIKLVIGMAIVSTFGLILGVRTL